MGFLKADHALALPSYNDATVSRTQRFEALAGGVDCDVAIVGGGLAGLSAAIELAERGFKVVVLEAHQVGWGASGRNGGQAIAGLACDQAVIESQLGLDEARRIWATTLEALQLIHQRCDRFAIDCDWRSGCLSLATSPRKARALQVSQERMRNAYGHETEWIAPNDLPRWIASPRFHAGTHDALSGHLHPLKYSLGLARAATGLGVRVYENTAVTAIVPGAVTRLSTSRGEVRAKQVLLAGNVYLQGLAPALARRIMPIGTYLVASAVLDPALAESLIPSQSAACDTNFVLDYFRPTADRRLLYGGRVSYSSATPINLAASMQKRMAHTFPQLKHVPVDYAWGGFVDITMNRAPDFGRLHHNVYYLQGFSGHGLALTGLAGKLVAEAMDGDAKRFDTFARIRHREFPGGAALRTPLLVLGMAWYRLKDLV